jgi:hypothetical protein
LASVQQLFKLELTFVSAPKVTTLAASTHPMLHPTEPLSIVLAQSGSNFATGSVRAGRGTAARPLRNSKSFVSSSAFGFQTSSQNLAIIRANDSQSCCCWFDEIMIAYTSTIRLLCVS